MKRSLFCFLLLTLFSNSLFAQEKEENTSIHGKHTLKVGYAYNTFNRVFSGLLIDFSTIETPSEFQNIRIIKNEKRLMLSSINLSYEYQLKDRLTVGLSLTTDIYKRTFQTPYKDSIFSIKEMNQVYNVMPNVYFHYLKSKRVDMYLGADVGVMLMFSKAEESNYNYGNEKNFKIVPTFNLCPIGVRLKYKVSPYLQVNFGSRGWIEGGLSYKF